MARPPNDLVIDRRAPELEPITPTDSGVPADEALMPFRIDILLGGSNRLLFDDGKLLLGGRADPSNGGTVDVSIVLPPIGKDFNDTLRAGNPAKDAA